MLTEHTANGLAEAPFKNVKRMKDSLLCVHVVVKTLKLEISRCHLADTSKNCTEVRVARAARVLVQIADAVRLTTR